jgi:hypothetical protein
MKRKIGVKMSAKNYVRIPAKTRTKTRANTTRAKPRAVRQQNKQKHEADSIDALVAAGAKALGIKIDPSWEASVKFNLQLIFTHAAKVDGFALPDDAEPAPIFHA